jgi:anti-sigma-K factor RskA
MADRCKIPDLLLERYALGELPEQARRDVEQQLAQSPIDQERLAEIRRSNESLLKDYPVEAAVRKIEERRRLQAAAADARRAKDRRMFLLLPMGSAIAAAAVFAVLLRMPPTPDGGGDKGHGDPGIESTRTKGLKPHLVVYKKPQPGQSPQELADGAAVRAHETLQLGYVAAGRPYGVVVSIDGGGAATLHFPQAQNQATRLGPGQTLLPSAYELDDAPLFERFFLITASTPIDVAATLRAAQELARSQGLAPTAPLALPAGVEQSSLLLRKTAPGSGP